MPQSTADCGNVYTQGDSFRAAAEAQQRRYRADALGVADDGVWGHLLSHDAATKGANFLTDSAREAAEARANEGKGVSRARTFGNMLSSQAMCFNLFAPLNNPEGHDILGRALGKFVGEMGTIRNIQFEYTPSDDVFQDQSGVGGVDCDLLIEYGTGNGPTGLLAIETKFVEQEFSRCGFRKPDSKTTCPCDVGLQGDRSGCLYTSKKGYLYWGRTDECRTLKPGSIPQSGCPFGDSTWQLWVNHTLVQYEARRRHASRAVFAVCAPSDNKALLGDRQRLNGFRSLLSDPASFVFLPLEELIADLSALVDGQAQWQAWNCGLRERYLVKAAER